MRECEKVRKASIDMCRILMRDYHELTKREEEGKGVLHVVHGRSDDAIKRGGKDELAVEEEETPKDKPNGEGEGDTDCSEEGMTDVAGWGRLIEEAKESEKKKH